MATSSRIEAIVIDAKKSSNNGTTLVWLDDSVEEDPPVKVFLSSLYDNVLTFTNADACMEYIESVESKDPCLSILISGKYGQLLARDRLQPLRQIKDIYVFCFDTVKHSRWAQTCDKVRCVFSDINKIFQCMQYDLQKTVEQLQLDEVQEQEQEQEQHHQKHDEKEQQQQQQQQHQQVQQRERFTDDNNLLDQVALDLILENPDDGAEDFADFCQTHNKDKATSHPMDVDTDAEAEAPVDVPEELFKPDQPIKEWYRSNLCFTDINSNDLAKLWTLRWFIKLFYRQLVHEHKIFIKDRPKCIVYYGTWLSMDEFDGMKHHIGQLIIITQLLMTYASRKTALESIKNEEKSKHKVLFEIIVDPTNRNTVPYAEIGKDILLLWFGARYHLIKIEYIEPDDQLQEPYWLIGLNLRSTIDSKPSMQNLYDYYFKELTRLNNVHHAFGRIFMYKGFYIQAEKWLRKGNHYYDLTELALRQSHFEQAKQYLELLPEDSDDMKLLHAYLYILTSSDNFSKARLILMKIISEATDKILRAKANIAIGFINLIMTQQIDFAFEHFSVANDVLRKLLPDIHPDVAKSYIGMGYTYYAQNNIVDAKIAFQTALTIQKQVLIYNHPDFAKSRSGFAHCFSADKHTIKQAMHELEYALNILLETFPHEHEHHPQILATRNDIEKLRKKKELRSRSTLLDYI